MEQRVDESSIHYDLASSQQLFSFFFHGWNDGDISAMV